MFLYEIMLESVVEMINDGLNFICFVLCVAFWWGICVIGEGQKLRYEAEAVPVETLWEPWHLLTFIDRVPVGFFDVFGV